MVRPKPTSVKRAAVIGLGSLGQRWLTLFQRQGLEVIAYDPETTGPARFSSPRCHNTGPFSLAADLISAVAGVDFVQECGPVDLKAKLELMTALDIATCPSIVIASSTANWAMTTLQQDLQHPERCVIGYPDTVTMMSVEVLGGQKTDPTTVEWAMAFYATLGQRAARLGNELPGFLTSQLRDAVWREAAEVVDRGLTTVKEIDAMMTYGTLHR